MPVFQAKEREKMLMEIFLAMLPVVYASHASNLTRRDDGGYATYVATETLRVAEEAVAVLELPL